MDEGLGGARRLRVRLVASSLPERPEHVRRSPGRPEPRLAPVRGLVHESPVRRDGGDPARSRLGSDPRCLPGVRVPRVSASRRGGGVSAGRRAGTRTRSRGVARVPRGRDGRDPREGGGVFVSPPVPSSARVVRARDELLSVAASWEREADELEREAIRRRRRRGGGARFEAESIALRALASGVRREADGWSRGRGDMRSTPRKG